MKTMFFVQNKRLNPIHKVSSNLWINDLIKFSEPNIKSANLVYSMKNYNYFMGLKFKYRNVWDWLLFIAPIKHRDENFWFGKPKITQHILQSFKAGELEITVRWSINIYLITQYKTPCKYLG